MNENEFINTLDEFEFTENGLVTGFTIRDYMQVSVTKNMLSDTYTYSIENVPSEAYSYNQLLSSSDFGKFKAEFELDIMKI